MTTSTPTQAAASSISPTPALPKDEIAGIFNAAIKQAFPALEFDGVTVENPKQASHGDYAVSSAMGLARALKQAPVAIAKQICEAIPDNDVIAETEIAGPGFINIRLTPKAKAQIVKSVLKAGDDFGKSNAGEGRSVIIEFVSANPTGPLHVGHGRQGALGDALANVFAANGWKTHREFYYNDAGNQIQNLTKSVQARAKMLKGEDIEFPEDGYHGDYIVELAQKLINDTNIDINDDNAVRQFAVSELRAEQDTDLKAFGVAFDRFYLESSLYTDGRVQKVVDAWRENGKLYEEANALWLRTTEYNDDKDRVVKKSDGSYTYFVPDVAYHVTKFERGFQKAVNIQGTDHFGTIARVRAGLQAIDQGLPEGFPDYVLHSMVKVMRGGKEVKISKRAGGYVTLRELIDEVGRDAVRFFLVSRKADSEFVFDIDLALSKTEDNPVYYIQYAHARICSVLAQWGGNVAQLDNVDLSPLTNPRETALMLRLAEYPERLRQALDELSPHLLVFYLKALAADFHGYYNAEKVLVEDEPVRLARLALLLAVRQVICNGMKILGVSAPESM